jgi:hypothetical protein
MVEAYAAPTEHAEEDMSPEDKEDMYCEEDDMDAMEGVEEEAQENSAAYEDEDLDGDGYEGGDEGMEEADGGHCDGYEADDVEMEEETAVQQTAAAACTASGTLAAAGSVPAVAAPPATGASGQDIGLSMDFEEEKGNLMCLGQGSSAGTPLAGEPIAWGNQTAVPQQHVQQQQLGYGSSGEAGWGSTDYQQLQGTPHLWQQQQHIQEVNREAPQQGVVPLPPVSLEAAIAGARKAAAAAAATARDKQRTAAVGASGHASDTTSSRYYTNSRRSAGRSRSWDQYPSSYSNEEAAWAEGRRFGNRPRQRSSSSSRYEEAQIRRGDRGSWDSSGPRLQEQWCMGPRNGPGSLSCTAVKAEPGQKISSSSSKPRAAVPAAVPGQRCHQPAAGIHSSLPEATAVQGSLSMVGVHQQSTQDQGELCLSHVDQGMGYRWGAAV